jgi:hypothetical protein
LLLRLARAFGAAAQLTGWTEELSAVVAPAQRTR